MNFKKLYDKLSQQRAAYMAQHHMTFGNVAVPAFDYEKENSRFNKHMFQDPIVNKFVERLTEIAERHNEMGNTYSKENNILKITSTVAGDQHVVTIAVDWDEGDTSLLIVSWYKQRGHISLMYDALHEHSVKLYEFERIYQLIV